MVVFMLKLSETQAYALCDALDFAVICFDDFEKPELAPLRQKFYDLAEDIEINRTSFTSSDIDVMCKAVDNFIKVCEDSSDSHVNLLKHLSETKGLDVVTFQYI